MAGLTILVGDEKKGVVVVGLSLHFN